MSAGRVPPPQVVKVQGFFANLSPLAFRKWARQYYDCAFPLLAGGEFSPVPYFLLCRAIELELKAEHIETKRQKEVKDKLGHHLVRSYTALPPANQTLDSAEFDVLTQADGIYSSKGFEYFNPDTRCAATRNIRSSSLSTGLLERSWAYEAQHVSQRGRPAASGRCAATWSWSPVTFTLALMWWLVFTDKFRARLRLLARSATGR